MEQGKRKTVFFCSIEKMITMATVWRPDHTPQQGDGAAY
jgi:hypothetical protein